MRLVQHESNNKVLAAPNGFPYDECKPAPVTVVDLGAGSIEVQTFWQPNDLEINAIIQGALIKISYLGHNMPPTKVEIEP